MHRYCLNGPVIVHDDVTWFCEDCEPEKPPVIESSTPLPFRTSHNQKLEEVTISAYLKLKNHLKRVKKNFRKRQKFIKMQKELEDTPGCLDQPKVALSNCSNSTSHRDQNHSERLKNNNKNHEEHKKFMKNHSHVNIRQELSRDCHTSDHDRIQSSEQCDQTQCSGEEQKKIVKQHEEQKKHKEQKKFMMKHRGTADMGLRQESSSDCHASNHNQIQRSEPRDNFEDTARSNMVSDSVQKSGVSLNDNVNIFLLDCWADAQPVAQPIWRGSFFICSQGIGPVRGPVAHASTLACSKVLDETKLFPEVLYADVLNRSAVWPKGFKDLGPTTESIALYIFPETERDEKSLDKLVAEIIFLDLAIRVELVNAEFLVFPSTVLPTQHWRFNTKYYLWGVFKSKQASKTNR